MSYQKHKYGSKFDEITSISVAEEDFLDKARQLNIKNIKAFYECNLFKLNKFEYDGAKKLIVQNI